MDWTLERVVILILLVGVFAGWIGQSIIDKQREKPQITVQQAEPDREYIRKYPVAGGGYEYILVREFRLEVEFEEEQ